MVLPTVPEGRWEGRRRPNVLVIGSFITDLVFGVPRYPAPGETLIGRSFDRYPGGKGANQAMAAARLGADVAIIGRVGNDLFGNEQIAGFNAAGIDTTGVVQDACAPSGVASVMIDEGGQNRIVIVPGANDRCTAEHIDTVRDRIAASDMLLLQLEIPLESVIRAIEIAVEVGTPVILNPAPAQPVAPEVLKQVAVLTPNEIEVRQLTGIPVETPEDAAVAACELLDSGVPAVVITLGARGALVMDAATREATMIPGFAVDAVDTVGAGDAFNGALAVKLAQGVPLLEAARFANAVAALSVTRPGAQPAMPSRDEVQRFIAASSA